MIGENCDTAGVSGIVTFNRRGSGVTGEKWDKAGASGMVIFSRRFSC